MLQTIIIPKNLKNLKEILPKANYLPIKIIHVHKKSFFKIINDVIEEKDFGLKLPSLKKNY